MGIGKILSGVKSLYDTHGVNQLVNSALIYNATKVGSKLLADRLDFGEGFATAGAIAAPIAVGAYLMSELGRIKNGFVKATSQALLAGALGYSVFSSLANYEGNSQIFQSGRNVCEITHDLVSRTLTDSTNPGSTGSLLGIGAAALAYLPKKKKSATPSVTPSGP